MYIKRVEIDGFKSYAQRQIVDEFDEQFNAITGLNGSGKSNILDSICFVLGITDLKCIRAENMNALVFKSGQAGINKATVTIVFDNKDKKNSPIGFHNADEIVVRRQVVINGRTSYHVNGSSMANNKVSDMFRSVGLNVNNPHFLIMQGRITKVLNMKPHEILGMVEEAAGTKLYETKRLAAVRIIEQKQFKVDEINRTMTEDIFPQMQKLKQDRINYQEWKKCETKLDVARRKLSAFIYAGSLQAADEYDEQIEEFQSKIRDCEEIVANAKATERNLESEIRQMERDKREKNDEGRSAVEDELRVAKEEHAVFETEKCEIIDEIESTKKDIEMRHKSIEEDNVELKKREAELATKESQIGGEEEKMRQAEEEIKSSKNKLELLARGMETDDQGQAVTLDGQIAATRAELKSVTTDVHKSEMRLKRIQPELSKKKKEEGVMSRQKSDEAVELQKLEKIVAGHEDALKTLNFNAKEDMEKREHCETMEERLQDLARKMNDIMKRDNRLEISYQSKPQNFDEKKDVFGALGTLFSVKDPKYAVAIETACGGYFFHVVVPRQATARALVDGKHLLSRKTFIPLDTINLQKIPGLKEKIAAAKKIAAERGMEVKLATDLIEFDPKFKTAMEYAFQGILVVDDPKLASDITFDRRVKLRTVTIRGDDNKPQGVVSGGAIDKRTPILQILAPYRGYKKEYDDLLIQYERTRKEVEKNEGLRENYLKIKDDMEKSSVRLQAIRDNVKNSPLQVLRDEITALEKEVVECEEVINGSRDKVVELNEKISEYEKRKKNEAAYRAKKQKEYQLSLKNAEAMLKQLKGSSAKATLDTIRAQIRSLKEQILAQEEEIVSLNDRIKTLSVNLNEKKDVLVRSQRKVDVAQRALDAFLNELRRFDDDMKKIEKKLDATRKDCQEAVTAIRSYENELKKREVDCESLRTNAAGVLKRNPWIEEEKIHFNQKGTDFDFTNYTKEGGEDQVKTLEDRKDELEKKLNTKAMQVLGMAEEQVLNLQRKKDRIDIDRMRLVQTIELLDEKKKLEVLKAHERVNKDFGNIFSTLLPNTMAQLVPPPGKTVLDGLEVKVAFNGKWKDSLNELSGGQRSLVALSLVLAMLKFKPAPIYILDEVDSALDLSHTQNIGHMIKKHFTNSQFIIVSLKEGMFNHANVLYQTKFVDGTSQVRRTDNRKAK